MAHSVEEPTGNSTSTNSDSAVNTCTRLQLLQSTHQVKLIQSKTTLIMSACSYRFTALPGYFVDNVAAANSSVGAKPVTARTRPNLGLIDRQYQGSDQDDKLLPWVRFRRHVEKLNREGSLTGESYKVLFLVRHGLSVHNVVMADVGSKEWKV